MRRLSSGFADEFDGLGGGDHDGREGQQIDEFVSIADDLPQLGVAEHAS